MVDQTVIDAAVVVVADAAGPYLMATTWRPIAVMRSLCNILSTINFKFMSFDIVANLFVYSLTI